MEGEEDGRRKGEEGESGQQRADEGRKRDARARKEARPSLSDLTPGVAIIGVYIELEFAVW